MYTVISHLFYKAKGSAIKILSTENGRIKLQTFDDVKIYAHTQGIFYFVYYDKRQFAEYYIQLAELMRGESHNRWATRCYLKALDEAWRLYQDIAIFHDFRHADAKNEPVNPYELYETVRLYMLETGNTGGLKRLKETHRKHREYADIELRYAHLSKRRDHERSIEDLLDKDFDPDRYHYD